MSENDLTDDLCDGHYIKVLIVDDYKPMRIMLRGRIGMEDGMMIIGEAVDGVEAVSLAKNISPDVIIMDINMPNKDGDYSYKRNNGCYRRYTNHRVHIS